LHEAQIREFPSDSDIEAFYEFANPLLNEEEKRFISFYSKEKNQIIVQNNFKKKSRNNDNEL